MRVLFISSPGTGHAFPLVPLAWALRAAGHEVLAASGGGAFRQAGLPEADVQAGFDMRAWIGAHPEFAPLMRDQSRDRVRSLADVVGFFAAMSDLRVDATVRLAAEWRPDLLVQSHLDAVGLVVAGRFGVPLVNHAFGFTGVDADEYGGLFREHMADAFDRHGVIGTPTPAAMVQVAPASMIGTSSARGVTSGRTPMRYVPYNGGGERPGWLSEVDPDGPPRLAVTLGSTAGRPDDFDPVRRVVAAAEGLGAELVLALGDRVDAETLGPLPDYARLAGWLPLNILLPACAALIHHGGAGTTLTALDAGVPQLVLPSGADRYINAEAVVARGVGIACHDDDKITPELLERLVVDDGLGSAAAEVRREMHAMPSPAALVATLTALVG